MPLIPFALFSFPDPAFSAEVIEKRLRRHLLLIFAAKEDYASYSVDDAPKQWSDFKVPYETTKRLRRRAKDIADCHANKSPLSRLREEDQKRITSIRAGVEVIAVPTEHRADEIAAALEDEYPWMNQANDAVWVAMRRSVRRGDPGFRMRPITLAGRPGIAKSHWGANLGRLLGVPSLIYESTIENASFGLVGSQKGWSNADSGQLIEMILMKRVANPVVVVNELEKAGSATSNTGRVFDLAGALLPLLEASSAQQWTCPFYKLPFDMGWINWIITVNDHRQLSAPLLSRCPPIHIPLPSLQHLARFAGREGQRRGLSHVSIDAVTAALTWAVKRGFEPDLRVVLRMLDLAEDTESRPVLH